MKAQLFIDSLRALTNNFEAFTLKLINKNSPLSHKIQDLSLNLLAFKSELLDNLCKLFKQYQNLQIFKKLQQQSSINTVRLRKLQLHALLKKKIKKIKKQSMMHSIAQQSLNQSTIQGPAVSKLKNSMILIQKDLGIHEELDNYQEQVSSVIHRSMTSLEVTPIKQHLRTDMSDTSMRIQDQYVLPENQTDNTFKNAKTKEDNEKIVLKTQLKVVLPKPQAKKKKTTVFSSKGGMLDNLLEQSLQSCLSGSQKV